ncbi:MAG: hypothetical protein ACPLKS_04765 [Caldisericum exile]|uniref:hypothetical protein n=1 Tax=Caldisericum exile TaxID=693075 RepID=UPI003C7371C2
MKERVVCVGCKQCFWRNKLKSNQIETVGDILCQKCKNKLRHEAHLNVKNKVNIVDESRFKQLMRMQLRRLERLERERPDVIKRIREKRREDESGNGESATN